jgi:hypothetical protein
VNTLSAQLVAKQTESSDLQKKAAPLQATLDAAKTAVAAKQGDIATLQPPRSRGG